MLISVNLRGQQRPVLSQYMFNGLLINPAYAGSLDYLTATAQVRQQWLNLEGAPGTQIVSGHSNIESRPVGVGAIISNEAIGIHNDFGFYAIYAYRLKMNAGVLHMGVQGGFNNIQSRYADLNVKHDEAVFSRNTNQFNPNFGTGLYYYTKNSYVGFSVPYILKRSTVFLVDESGLGRQRYSRYYFLTAGHLFRITENFIFKPSTLVRMEENAPVAVDLNANVLLEDVVYLGISFRNFNDLIALFEIQVNNAIRIGYSYDWGQSELSNFNSGTHEFMVNYRINIWAPRKHRMCPGPFYF